MVVTRSCEQCCTREDAGYIEWKAGGSRESYNAAKRVARQAVYHAKSESEKVVLENIDLKTASIYKQMRWDNQSVMGEKQLKDDSQGEVRRPDFLSATHIYEKKYIHPSLRKKFV